MSNREADAYADAVLVAVLRYLVALKREGTTPLGDRSPADGVLTVAGVEIVDEVVRQSQEIALFAGERFGSMSEADESYRGHRRVIDPLWRYVETYGLPALLLEARSRSPRENGVRGS